jgi:hypothetical protein
MKDDKDRSENASGSASNMQPRWWATGRTYRRPCGLGMLVAVAAVGLTACSGGSSGSPHVASLGTSTTTAGGGHGGTSTTTAPKGGNATKLMDQWAACMRANGDPNQTDPTIDQYGVIHITIPLGVSEELSSEAHGSSGPCSQDELAAENDLRAANPVAPPPTQAQLLQYVDCMRTHGVADYPDPGPNNETKFPPDVDPSSPTFENANKVCGKQVNAPAWWIAGTGPPGDVVVSSAGIGPNGPHPGSQSGTGGPTPASNSGSGSNG